MAVGGLTVGVAEGGASEGVTGEGVSGTGVSLGAMVEVAVAETVSVGALWSNGPAESVGVAVHSSDGADGGDARAAVGPSGGAPFVGRRRGNTSVAGGNRLRGMSGSMKIKLMQIQLRQVKPRHRSVSPFQMALELMGKRGWGESEGDGSSLNKGGGFHTLTRVRWR